MTQLRRLPRPTVSSLLPAPERWMSRGACAGTNDPDAWFPEEGHADRDPRTLAALSTCNGCPVRSECLRHALEHGERYGIWGGMTERQRATFTRRRGAGTGDAA